MTASRPARLAVEVAPAPREGTTMTRTAQRTGSASSPEEHRLSRREVLRWFGAGGIAMGLAACSPTPPRAEPGATSAPPTTAQLAPTLVAPAAPTTAAPAHAAKPPTAPAPRNP